MYKTAETGLETRAPSARVSKVSKVLCIPVYTDTAWYKVFMPCRCTIGTYTPWLRPRDSCTLCPAGSGVPDATHEQTTYVRRLARDTYNSYPEVTTQKACTNTLGTYFARDTYKTCPRGYDEESVYKHARPSEV